MTFISPAACFSLNLKLWTLNQQLRCISVWSYFNRQLASLWTLNARLRIWTLNARLRIWTLNARQRIWTLNFWSSEHRAKFTLAMSRRDKNHGQNGHNLEPASPLHSHFFTFSSFPSFSPCFPHFSPKGGGKQTVLASTWTRSGFKSYKENSDWSIKKY